MKLSRIQGIALGALGTVIVLVGAGFFLRHPIQKAINGVRAERLLEKAETAFSEERWEQASRQGQAAYYLDPDNEEIQILIARSTLKQRMRSTVEWWHMVKDEPDLPVDELRELTAGLLASGDLENGLVFLNRLSELAPEDASTKRLILQSLELQKRFTSALDFAGELAKGGDESWDVHRYYMAFEEQLNSEGGSARVTQHLRSLIDGGSELALPAARDLALKEEVDAEDRLYAAEFLRNNAVDQLDTLFAQSVRAREGLVEEEEVQSIVRELIDEESAYTMEMLVNWANFMNATDWLLKNLPFEKYAETGASREIYFNLLYRNEAYSALLESVEDSLANEESAGAAMLHYYRAIALRNLGEMERSREALALAVRVADPRDSASLENNLIRDQEWDLLIELYKTLRTNEPENKRITVKLLAAYYYLGRQEGVASVLDELSVNDFSDSPPQSSFVLYLKLIIDGYSAELHQAIERYQAEFPQISDFRPVLGLSYLLQDKAGFARDFLEEIPELGLSSPRYIRIATALLGRDARTLLIPGEREYLLARELYLLSRYANESSL